MIIRKTKKVYYYLLQGELLSVLKRKFLKHWLRIKSSDFFYWLDAERVLSKRFEQSFKQELGLLESVANYFVPTQLNLNSQSIVYSGGLGGDADFDIELIQRYGCQVHIFDPTPDSYNLGRCLEGKYPQITFHPVALWDKEEEINFSAPKSGGSASAVFTNDGEFFSSIAKSIPAIMAENGHELLDLLKLDIEGAAEKVLWEMFEQGVFPQCVVCEFERPMGDVIKTAEFFVGINRLVKFCECKGYRILRLPREKYNYFGIHLMFIKT